LYFFFSLIVYHLNLERPLNYLVYLVLIMSLETASNLQSNETLLAPKYFGARGFLKIHFETFRYLLSLVIQIQN